jgi:hypothetical protein
MQELDFGRVFDLYGEIPRTALCQHECCDRLELHGHHELIRGVDDDRPTRSKRHATCPWRAQYARVLRESVYEAVSLVEPRSFQMIVHEVHNNYGSCLDRSIHRHLKTLRESGAIVRLSWKTVHAYLRPNSRLLSEPALVYEQVLAMSRVA